MSQTDIIRKHFIKWIYQKEKSGCWSNILRRRRDSNSLWQLTANFTVHLSLKDWRADAWLQLSETKQETKKPWYQTIQDLWMRHMNSQHGYGHAGKVWKQLENCINGATRKNSISPHLFLHFYIFENCMDSPRFCKHCSKCSCVSHCKNPRSDLKIYMHKKRQSYLDVNFRQLFCQDPEKKENLKNFTELKFSNFSFIAYLLFLLITSFPP